MSSTLDTQNDLSEYFYTPESGHSFYYLDPSGTNYYYWRKLIIDHAKSKGIKMPKLYILCPLEDTIEPTPSATSMEKFQEDFNHSIRGITGLTSDKSTIENKILTIDNLFKKGMDLTVIEIANSISKAVDKGEVDEFQTRINLLKELINDLPASYEYDSFFQEEIEKPNANAYDKYISDEELAKERSMLKSTDDVEITISNTKELVKNLKEMDNENYKLKLKLDEVQRMFEINRVKLEKSNKILTATWLSKIGNKMGEKVLHELYDNMKEFNTEELSRIVGSFSHIFIPNYQQDQNQKTKINNDNYYKSSNGSSSIDRSNHNDRDNRNNYNNYTNYNNNYHNTHSNVNSNIMDYNKIYQGQVFSGKRAFQYAFEHSSGNDNYNGNNRNVRQRTMGGCGSCRRYGHERENCWELVGYPVWHPKGRNQNEQSNYYQSNSLTTNNAYDYFYNTKP